MNGFIPNTLNNTNNNQNQNHPPPVVMAPAAAVAVPQPQPPPSIMMNGAIPNHLGHLQQPQPQHNHHPQLVHYVQHQGIMQPQLMIPNGNVIQLAPSPPPPPMAPNNMVHGPIFLQQPQQQQAPPPQIHMMVNGTIPGGVHLQPTTTSSSLGPGRGANRLIRLTPNGTYATTLQPSYGLAGTSTVPAGTSTTLILTKPPPPKCLQCCLACCGLESLWFNPNFHFSRVIALICNILVDLLMILCLLSTNWLTTVKYRQGLWQYCIDVGSPRPLPFGLDDHDGCHWGRNAAYIKLSGFFAVACFSLAIIATLLTALGLSSRDPNKKYTFYRFALYINLGALLAIIVSLTLYPAFFYSELHHTNMVPANRPHWYFGWAYGVGWGAAIFLVGAILLLVCDKETEEIYYQERTIVHANNHHHNNLNHNNHHHQQQLNHHHLNHNLNHPNHNQTIKA